MKRNNFSSNKKPSDVPPTKTPKFDDGVDDYDDDGFEAEFMGNEVDDIENACGEASIQDITLETAEFEKWLRPQVPNIDSKSDDLVFQQFEIDHYEINDALQSRHVFRLYGVNSEGSSVMAHVHDFFPYFYVKVDKDFHEGQQALLRSALSQEIKNNIQNRHVTNPIVSIEPCMKSNIYGFTKESSSPFVKVTVALSRLVATCKRIIQDGVSLRDRRYQFEIFDNVEFTIRYMVDSLLVGCSWVELPKTTYDIRTTNKTSHCQLEVDVSWNKVICHPAVDKWSAIAPLRILSFDIECAGRKGVFPDATVDPVIQISNMVTRYGEQEPFIKNIFTLNTCAPIVGAHVISYDNEYDLLENWSKFIREVDPDIITGYNIQNFDLPYLITRAGTLEVKGFKCLGKIKGVQSRIVDKQVNSKQMGRRENKLVTIDGRTQFDLFQVVLRDHKLRSYSLNAVSYHFLGEQKDDVAHQIITDLQNGDDQTRRRLAEYCLKDSYLVLRLLNKLMCIVNYIEMSRVTGVPLSYLLAKGQQIKVLSQLLRKAATQDFVLPDYQSAAGEEFIGAIVLEPKRGFYTQPIATLDFSSLYPSIMMAHNLCYTTLLRGQAHADALGLSKDDYVKTPYGKLFVKSSIKRGLLPEILVDLIEARGRAKKELALEKDPFKRQVLDGRQLALKVSANSVYGFTGAQVGRLPCLEISSSVTAYGREMIEKTKRLVEEEFTIAKGYEHDAEVVYGDTDSVMCKFGVETVAEAMKLGREAAKLISDTFDRPIKLEFEKVYWPYLLINKKRYAGMYYTREDKYDRMDCKGLETVRRDNCPLVASLVTTCLEKLLINRDANAALEHAQSAIADLLCNRVDISQLIVSKELTKTDEEYSSPQPHVVLAKKMKARDEGSAPKLGDRVPYIVVAGRDKNISTRAEDPIYVLDNDVPIDTNYYLNNQITKPLLRIFEPIFGSRANDKLLKGKHTLCKAQTHSSVGPLSRFTVVRETCIGCRNVLKTNERSVCGNCMPKAAQIFMKESLYLSSLEDKFSRLWTECQRCSGSLLQEVLCNNRDCPIFYMRKKVQKDVTQQSKIVKKLDLDLSW